MKALKCGSVVCILAQLLEVMPDSVEQGYRSSGACGVTGTNGIEVCKLAILRWGGVCQCGERASGKKSQ